MAKSFRELKVWNKSMDMAVMIYSLTSAFPKQETYGLSSQMRRAAVSVASNIAEGSAPGTKRDFKQFVAIAKGSNCELQTQLMLADRLGFGTKQELADVQALTHEIGQMLSGLSKYLSLTATRAKTEN